MIKNKKNKKKKNKNNNNNNDNNNTLDSPPFSNKNIKISVLPPYAAA